MQTWASFNKGEGNSNWTPLKIFSCADKKSSVSALNKCVIIHIEFVFMLLIM